VSIPNFYKILHFSVAEGWDFSSNCRIRNGWIKVKFSPWRSIALETPVTNDNARCNGDYQRMHVKLDKLIPYLFTKITDWSIDLLERSFVRFWWVWWRRAHPMRALQGDHHRADSEKSAKLMLGSRMPCGRDVSSIVRRWGLRPLNARFSFIVITCTFNGKYRWYKMKHHFLVIFINENFSYSWILWQFKADLSLIKVSEYFNSFYIISHSISRDFWWIKNFSEIIKI